MRVVPGHQPYDPNREDLFRDPSNPRFQILESGVQMLDKEVCEQQFLLSIPKELCTNRICVIGGPGFAQGRTDTRVFKK